LHFRLDTALHLVAQDSGVIQVRGRSVKEDSKHAARELIAYVPQDAQIFSGTVRSNLHYGMRTEIDSKHFAQVVHMLGITEMVAALPLGLDTEVGECGKTLSGGQRQRLAIARALLSDCPVLLLDEATSGLDTAAERRILEAVRELAQGRTLILISHRPRAIEIADRILRVGDAKLKERTASNATASASPLAAGCR
jgi:ABC-type multidrug transport system fused ATPase/permease subunit